MEFSSFCPLPKASNLRNNFHVNLGCLDRGTLPTFLMLFLSKKVYFLSWYLTHPIMPAVVTRLYLFSSFSFSWYYFSTEKVKSSFCMDLEPRCKGEATSPELPCDSCELWPWGHTRTPRRLAVIFFRLYKLEGSCVSQRKMKEVGAGACEQWFLPLRTVSAEAGIHLSCKKTEMWNNALPELKSH